MNNFGNDIITYIFEYIVEKKYNCVLTMEDKTRHEYTKNTLINKNINQVINRNCDIFYIYKPKFKILPILCECASHNDDLDNNINVINQLNYLKLNNDKKLIRELEFKNYKECMNALPYVREIVDMAHLSKQKTSIYLIKARKRFSGFF